MLDMNARSPIVFSEEEKVIVEMELLSKQPSDDELGNDSSLVNGLISSDVNALYLNAPTPSDVILLLHVILVILLS